MVTLSDVAKRAGVAPITVSRVANGLGSVKADTRERVEAVIRELGYYPNRQAQALNSGRIYSLGFITPRTYALPLHEHFYVVNLLSGLEKRSWELGWDMLLSTDHDKAGVYDFLRIWHQRKVDGLVFVGLAPVAKEQREEIERTGVPCVCIGDRIGSKGISWVDADSEGAVKDALRRFWDRGHTRVAYLGPDTDLDYNPNFKIREQVALQVGTRLGMDVQILRTRGEAPEAGAQQFLALPRRPTAILAGNDTLALTFMDVCAGSGLVAGRDYSIIGFDADPAGQKREPSLASFRMPLMQMGMEAADLLVGLIKGEIEKDTRVFPMEFIDGKSLGPVPGKQQGQ